MSREHWNHLGGTLAVIFAAVLLLLSERRVYQTAARLKRETAELRLVSERARLRSEALKAEIDLARKERALFTELPLSFGQSAAELKAAIEQCALACGVSCLVSAAAKEDGMLIVEAAFRTSPAKTAALLREIMSRREFFLPQRLEIRTLEPGVVSAEAEFAAFLEKTGQSTKDES